MTAPMDSTVILLHGLGRSSLSMKPMQLALQLAGYKVVNVDYPSRRMAIPDLAVLAIEKGLEQCNNTAPQSLHFVTHSLGGILLRSYLAQHTIPSLHRTVMLGPPNRGSELVDKLKHLPGYYLFNGPAGMQLGTGIDDLPAQLGAFNAELGIIAGRLSLNLLLSRFLPSPNDGKVSVASTHIEGMRDFISLPVSHTFMMNNPLVIRQTLLFLKHGQFDHHARTELFKRPKHE